MTSGLESLGGSEVRRLGALDRRTRGLVGLEMGRLVALPARTRAVVDQESERALRGLGRLSDPDVLLLSPTGVRTTSTGASRP